MANAIAIYGLLVARQVRVYACTEKERTTWRYAFTWMRLRASGPARLSSSTRRPAR